MTFREAMLKRMTDRGMFNSQATAVIDQYIEEKVNDQMEGRWNESIENYPEGVQVVVWMGVRDYAHTWIETNIPEAWFKPMFLQSS